MAHKKANRLIHESSPYLLQHAYNPVDWYPWGEEALEKARKEDKPLLISIGYSACHWCHVMEKESFEDKEVAAIMNKYFVCIKIDREERPDLDSLYMLAVQLMSQRGGWPLNCFALPDGRPIYGGTYFPKNQWMNVLQKIHEMYHHQPVEVMEYANRLADGLKQTQLFKVQAETNIFPIEELHQAIDRWKSGFDNQDGGLRRAPKFPMPVNYQFLLDYAIAFKRDDVLQHVKITLDAIARGGIYDHIGGGFARYSVDGFWKVPHFEKMLYDNAQLISLFSKAYAVFREPRYKEVVIETISFLDRDMKNNEPCYFSALDADSEGVEGKFYVWQLQEIKELLKGEFTTAEKYFHFDDFGHWEHGNYILMRKANVDIAPEDAATFQDIKQILLDARSKRVFPGIDDKYLLSWNALTISGLCDAYKFLGYEAYLQKAISHFQYLTEHFKNPEGGYFHTRKNGKSSILAFLDDYSTMALAALDLFACTGEDDYYHQVVDIIDFVDKHFAVNNSQYYFYATESHNNPVTRQVDVEDNVIPSSNAMMAHVLYYMAAISGNVKWKDKALKMLNGLKDEIVQYPSGYALWAKLRLLDELKLKEAIITGEGVENNFLEFHRSYYPGVFAVRCVHSSNVPMLKGKFSAKTTQIFICEGEKCYAPVATSADAYELINLP